MPLILAGATSGSTTLQATDAVTATITLPSTSGTVVVNNGAQTIEFADGSASAPSITNSGDTNTGIFFPAADTIAFTEGGTESMRISSTGGVSIGNTTDAGASNLSVTGSVTAASLNTPNTFGFKNRIINGAMVIDQRNAGASVTPAGGTGTYSIDRWGGYNSQGSKYTIQQNAGSVTPPAGFSKYLGITSTSAYTLVSSDQFQLTQVIEAYNIVDLGFGTANASTITLSFWVRSSLTGTFGGVYRNSGTPSYRSCPFTYTISASNTWEQKTITVAGDTTGTWETTNGSGLQVTFTIGAGSTFIGGTANTWSAGNVLAPTTLVNILGTNGATFYITGVQLEKGSTATSFDVRDYGSELDMCYRYYFGGLNGRAFSISTQGAASNGQTYPFITFILPVSMRTTPTITPSGSTTFSGVSSYNSQTLNAQWGYTSGTTALTLKLDNPATGAFSLPIIASAEF